MIISNSTNQCFFSIFWNNIIGTFQPTFIKIGGKYDVENFLQLVIAHSIIWINGANNFASKM
jgi:hypothetical protein